MRLHDWVAEEKGYFADEGLEYEFAEQLQSNDGKVHDPGSGDYAQATIGTLS